MTASTTAVRTLAGARALRAVGDRRRPASPAQLARRLDPKFVITPTICLLSDIAVRSVDDPDQRDVVTTAPRVGKSRTLAIWNPVWTLMKNPDAQIAIVSYSDELATTHSREVRRIIKEHSDYLGFKLSDDKTSAGRFTVEGREGGVLACGLGSSLTGRGFDLVVLDDVLKNAAEADSAAHRRRIWNEYQATVATRIHPGGSILLVQTRWAVDDLAGKLLDTEPDVWGYTNVPAIAEVGIPDALDREPGAVMVSALGYTAEHYAAARRTSGERHWYALYMGSPTTLEGGLVKRAWFDDWRVSTAPQRPLRVVIGVDPSDSGSGDSCGLVAASITADGVVALIADESAPMTSEQWGSAAVRLAIETGASEIAIEGFAARETYTRVVSEALKRVRTTRQIKVSSWPPKGSGRGGGDAIARASALLQALETGTCRVVGHWPELEERAVQWMPGQHQPDQLAALVVAHDVLVHSLRRQMFLSDPTRLGSLGDRERADRFGGRRFDGRRSMAPVDRRLTRRLGGNDYVPELPRRTLRGL